MCKLNYQLPCRGKAGMAFYLWFAGVHCLSLFSSPSSEDGQVTVCPGTTVTLTCTASQVEILTWIQEPDWLACDTDLVLVGERVAYCSLLKLQWLPSSDDVQCVQPPPGISFCLFTLFYISFSHQKLKHNTHHTINRCTHSKPFT